MYSHISTTWSSRSPTVEVLVRMYVPTSKTLVYLRQNEYATLLTQVLDPVLCTAKGVCNIINKKRLHISCSIFYSLL